MIPLLEVALANTLVALPLAVAARLAAVSRAPSALVHALWVVVLLKLVTPPLIQVPVPSWLHEASSPNASVLDSNVQDSSASDSLELAQEPGVAPERTVPTTDDTAPADRPQLSPAVSLSRNEPSSQSAGLLMHPSRPHADTTNASPRSAGPRPDAPAVQSMRSAPTGESAEPAWVLPAWAVSGLVGLWAFGTLGFAVAWLRRLSRQYRHIQTMRAASPDVQQASNDIARLLGLRRTPVVVECEAPLTPMVWSLFGYTRVIVPRDLIHTLRPAELHTLLAHEFAHVRRRDPWVRHLEMVVRMTHWWNPVAWWACRELRTSEEECCDAWVTSVLPACARDYTGALLATVEYVGRRGASAPAVASGIGSIPELRRRVHMIIRGTTTRSMTSRGRLGVLAAAAVLLPCIPVMSSSMAQDSVSGAALTQDQGVASTSAGDGPALSDSTVASALNFLARDTAVAANHAAQAQDTAATDATAASVAGLSSGVGGSAGPMDDIDAALRQAINALRSMGDVHSASVLGRLRAERLNPFASGFPGEASASLGSDAASPFARGGRAGRGGPGRGASPGEVFGLSGGLATSGRGAGGGGNPGFAGSPGGGARGGRADTADFPGGGDAFASDAPWRGGVSGGVSGGSGTAALQGGADALSSDAPWHGGRSGGPAADDRLARLEAQVAGLAAAVAQLTQLLGDTTNPSARGAGAAAGGRRGGR